MSCVSINAPFKWGRRDVIKRLFENFVLKGTEWLFRVLKDERFLIASGVGLLIAVYGGFPLLAVLLRIVIGAVPEGYLNAQQALDGVDRWILCIASLLVGLGVLLIIARFIGDAKARSKKRVVVIEARGLRDDDGSPLSEVAANHHEGAITKIMLDLRNRLDGDIIQPERALDEISSTQRSVLQHQKNFERSDLTTVYGGLTSVPYTFLTGVLLDDEGNIVTYDWDRVQEAWRKVEGEDDEVGFHVDGLGALSDASDIVVAIAYSYPINDDDLATTFDFPVVRLTLGELSSDSHWSQEKQNRLAQRFLETTKQLSAIGAKRIHLVLAAPNSVVFTFGRRYDKRNLP
ncbi:MAG: SAVED domain-containing protein, partial [Wenzhouxiangella sp.]|nr:SAVED domain-containing protein [Wenzhouxiangella sp.]